MTQTVSRVTHTTGLLAWLRLQSGYPVGDGIAPADVGWQGAPGQSPFQGYGVVHTIAGGALDGPMCSPSADADLLWQVNGMGGTQAHADTVMDTFSGLLLGPLPPLQIAGRALLWVRSDVFHGAARQDPDQPSIWWSYARYRIGTTPLT